MFSYSMIIFLMSMGVKVRDKNKCKLLYNLILERQKIKQMKAFQSSFLKGLNRLIYFTANVSKGVKFSRRKKGVKFSRLKEGKTLSRKQLKADLFNIWVSIYFRNDIKFRQSEFYYVKMFTAFRLVYK